MKKVLFNFIHNALKPEDQIHAGHDLAKIIIMMIIIKLYTDGRGGG